LSGRAAAVPQGHRDPLGFGVEASLAAHVEHDRRAAEDPAVDRGDHSRLAERPAGQPGGDRLAGVELRGAQTGQQLVVVEEDHDRGAHAPGAGQPIGREPLQETAERLAHQLWS